MTRLPGSILQDAALSRVLDALETAPPADGGKGPGNGRGNGRALLVGGAVRNALLGLPVHDIDIATDILPPEVMARARHAGLRAVPTGLDHGTVTVICDGRGFEVTTFRLDVQTDGRHAVVAFTTDLEQDARRRDFTINALYADRHGRVLDPVQGLPDLAARRLRFVGAPADRIREDYLRILRFFRFLAWYGRDADPDALAACAAHAEGLTRIARERIGAEMRKLLAAPDPGPAIALMHETGVLAQVLPLARPDRLALLLRHEDRPGPWLRRLAALAAQDPTDALRLSRSESRALARLHDALARGTQPEDTAWRHGLDAGLDHGVLVPVFGGTAAPGWQDRVRRAAEAPLPVTAADLAPLSGPALGRGLKAAEAAWIASGFSLPAPALIDAAHLAAKDET